MQKTREHAVLELTSIEVKTIRQCIYARKEVENRNLPVLKLTKPVTHVLHIAVFD